MLKTVEDDLTRRFHHVMEKREYDVNNVAAGREFIEAFIGWVVSPIALCIVQGAGGHGEKHGGRPVAAIIKIFSPFPIITKTPGKMLTRIAD